VSDGEGFAELIEVGLVGAEEDRVLGAQDKVYTERAVRPAYCGDDYVSDTTARLPTQD